MGEEKEDKDLRKEVEMTEHTDSIATVCNQYNTDPDKGLTSAAAEEVSIKLVITFPLFHQSRSMISFAFTETGKSN